ncbi:MAG: DUF1295 domain-containing protein [Desulfuromonadales bacterium]|nr:DUF1295 domain-containing protein [Desulfuromonadales bacterium]
MNLFTFAILSLLVFMTLLFGLALRVKDNSIVDVGYGLAFVLVGWSSYFYQGNSHSRQLLLLALITIWGVRLAGHIFMRKQGETGEDFRYRQWRKEWGKTFVWRSFLQIFMLQGAVVFMVSLPILLVTHQPGGDLGVFDLLGVSIWLIGFVFEALSDWQLLRFKRNPDNRGKLMQTGLWRTTRHPNYFGEATLWWGIFLIACSAPLGWLAVISPLLINLLLLKVSGIPMLEAKYAGNPQFESYKSQTNAFFPWFPKTDRREI